MTESFTWRDGERTIRFGRGTAAEAPQLLRDQGFDRYTLFTTERAQAAAPGMADAASEVLLVPPGKVDEISAALLDRVDDGPLVALGGGRVVDVAKAIAGTRAPNELPVVTLATSLSGAEFTRSHRRPAGVEGARLVRPTLVIADPELMASAPTVARAATAMNALAHTLEATYTPYSNPVCTMAALRGATLLAAGVENDDADALALGALLAGYACGATSTAVHHATCQTIVRVTGSPHGETNAVMLPHSARLMLTRAPEQVGAFAGALGDPESDPAAAAGLAARLAAHSGHVRLRTLGVEESHVDTIVDAVTKHPMLALTPDPPEADELREYVAGAL